MSFSRTAFLVWLVLLVAIGTVVVSTHRSDEELRRGTISDLIDAAGAHARELRRYAEGDSRFTTIDEEAQRWERLAATAKIELMNLEMKAR